MLCISGFGTIFSLSAPAWYFIVFHFVEYISPANWPQLVYVCLTIIPRTRIDSEAMRARGIIVLVKST